MSRRWSAVAAAGALLVVAALTGFALTPTAQATDTQSRTETVSRVFYSADGTTTPADPSHPGGYDVQVTVSSTQNLRGDQPITVSWTGAHPTGGLVPNPTYGAQGSEMEYPFILMECRGTQATLTPSTCWTQTSSAERIQRSGAASFPAWRSDGKADDNERKLQVGVPSGLKSSCAPTATENVHWTPIKALDGTSYYGGCLDDAPEQSEEASSGVPDNTTYGITGTDGKGSAQFAVWTADENATLGCSATVACSLVAIPITGIDCDPYFTQTADKTGAALGIKPTQYASFATKCEAADQWAPGEVSDNLAKYNLATSGQLWWAASNWANRIVVPLSFAVSGSTCAVVNDTTPLLAYGSILMTDIAAQWQPYFCTSRGYQPFLHVQTTDSSARGLVGGDSPSIEVGLSSLPPDDGFGAAVAQAPIAVSGFAIAYKIDGADGQPYTKLRLNARLVAKLLSESYAGAGGGDDAGIAGNPTTILADPEFHALNPDLPTGLQQVVNSAAAMISLSSDSDMLTALSHYILSDSDAKHWLEGAPDPWGMKVNPAYQLDLPSSQAPDGSFALPVSSWPLLDQWKLPDSSDHVCLNGIPFLGQIAHPLSQVSQIVEDIEFGISNSQTTCPDATDPNAAVAKTEGLQTPGHRFVIGIVPLTSLQRYGLSAAALETSSNIGPGTKFTDASGKTFASPDLAGMKTAAKLLSADSSAGAWTLDYSELDSQTGAYPGLMPVYADVRTTGLGASDAARVAQLLDFAAGTGQTAGTGNGQLAPGALPMTSGNGLGAEAAYTRCVARQVKAQTGVVPPLTGSCPAVPTKTKPTKSASASSSSTPSTVASTPPAGSTGAVVAPPVPSAAASAPALTQVTTTSATVKTVGAYSGLGRWGLPITLVVGLLLLVVGLGLRWGAEAWAAAKVVGPRTGPWLSSAWARYGGRRRR